MFVEVIFQDFNFLLKHPFLANEGSNSRLNVILHHGEEFRFKIIPHFPIVTGQDEMSNCENCQKKT